MNTPPLDLGKPSSMQNKESQPISMPGVTVWVKTCEPNLGLHGLAYNVGTVTLRRHCVKKPKVHTYEKWQSLRDSL